MHVELAPELQQFVAEKVASGTYASSSDVIGAGIRLLKQYEAGSNNRRDTLIADLSLGIEQADRGELVDGGVFMADLLAKHDRRIKSEK